MTAAPNGRWSSLLQELAAYINNVKVVAVATQIQIVARGLDDLTGPGISRRAPRARPCP
jgi:hypothetical protein